MRITRANNAAIKFACLHFHYAKSVPVNTLGYNVYNDDDEWCGVILYGIGANNNIGAMYGLPQGAVLELVRVALNGKQEYTSKDLAMTIKQLRKDVPYCKLIVPYADCDQKHLGTIYQATNWIYVGTIMKDKTDSSWIINGKRYHGRIISDWVKSKGGLNGLTREAFLKKYYDRNATPYVTKGKRKYLMPMDKKIKKQVEALRKPYPKNDEWQKIDRTQFEKRDESEENN